MTYHPKAMRKDFGGKAALHGGKFKRQAEPQKEDFVP